MIKATKHSLKFTNKYKKSLYISFLKEYRRVAQLYFNYLWEFGYVCEHNDQLFLFDIPTNNFELPRYIDYRELNEILNITSPLSARASTQCLNQVIGCLKSSTEKQRRRFYIYKKLLREGKEISKKLLEKINKPLTKPNISNINPELSSKCCDFKKVNNLFDGFLQLSSIGKSFGKIRLPIKFHQNSNKWKSKGNIKTSFLFSNKNIQIRWEIEEPSLRTEGSILGADQGKTDILVLSNNMKTPQTDNHSYTLTKIINKMSRKIKGSKAFGKCQIQRQNFVNWSINQLNFNNVKTIKLEKIVNINYGKKTSRKMSHWSNPLIRDKIISKCEEVGVQLILQSSTYRSQRCSSCGLVRKANRKGKEFKCRGKFGCSFVCDADLNAAKNHEQELPDIPKKLRELRKNLGEGFFWKPEGFFNLTGKEFEVPSSKKEKEIIISNYI